MPSLPAIAPGPAYSAGDGAVNRKHGGPRTAGCGELHVVRSPNLPIRDCVTPRIMAEGMFKLLELLEPRKLTLSINKPTVALEAQLKARPAHEKVTNWMLQKFMPKPVPPGIWT